MFGKYFDTTVVDDFCARVVKELKSTLTIAQLEGTTPQAVKRREQAQERVRRHAQTLAATTLLNVYQKAKLGVRLEDALEAAGYPKAFSKDFGRELVSVVAKAASQRP